MKLAALTLILAATTATAAECDAPPSWDKGPDRLACWLEPRPGDEPERICGNANKAPADAYNFGPWSGVPRKRNV